MKKIIVILIFFLVSCQINVAYNNNKSLEKFKIMCIGYTSKSGEFVKFSEPSVLIEQINDKLIFYEYEISKNGYPYINPVKDLNNAQKTLSKNDAKYLSKLSLLIFNNSVCQIIGKPDEIYFAIAYKAEEIEGKKILKWKGECFTKEGSTKKKVNYYFTEEVVNLGSTSYFDSDYCYQLQDFNDSGYYIKLQKAINPDVDILNRSQFVPYEDLINSKSAIYFHGFAEISLENKTICYNGKEYDLAVDVQIMNNEYSFDLNYFLELFQGVLVGDSFSGDYTTYRLYGECSNQPNIIKLQFKIGDINTTVNGKPYKLLFRPYETEDENKIFLPLKDLCTIFRSPFHHRVINNTILIPLFIDEDYECNSL